MARRKKKGQEEENHERWLLTYADMITLLMAFFIMMYSMSVLNLQRFRAAASSIRTGFNAEDPGEAAPPGAAGGEGIFDGSKEPLEAYSGGASWEAIGPLADYIDKEYGGAEKGDTGVDIGQDHRGIVITMRSDAMVFLPGQAIIRKEAYPLLDRIAVALDQIDNLVQVEGHTCDIPPKSYEFPTNWELSAARATNVLRYLVERKNLPPDRFSVAAYGSMRPIAPNDSEENRKRNRRVELIIIRKDTVMDLDKVDGDSAGGEGHSGSGVPSSMSGENKKRKIDETRATIRRRQD